MKAVKSISWFIGISIFMFGIVKFVNPFKGWYSVQITNSGLGEYSYWIGITGEIIAGLTLIISLFRRQKMAAKLFKIIIQISSATIIIIMLTGVYVHLQPNVPAAVLPLKIKPPYIPLFFLLLALTNIILIQRRMNDKPNK